MRLVSVTRILNEDDIVEAFVRHNAVGLDHMVFLDHGSSDRTLDILRALQREGIPLSVFQAESAEFDEMDASTWLYRLADRMHGADWVVFLDADEFLTGEKLADRLASLTRRDQAIRLQLVHYYNGPDDDPAELNVPVRMRWRRRDESGVFKIVARGGMGARLMVDAGNHGGIVDGHPLATMLERQTALAHYPRRNGWQNLQKLTLGWLRVLAAGAEAVAQGRASHYRAPFELLRDRPQDLLRNPAYLDSDLDRADAVVDPIVYRGGALRYTVVVDPAMKAFTLGMRYAEQLARQHGRLVDHSLEARRLAAEWKSARRFLF
ncbi:MAG: glycosyltransferase family 2 protein [Acidiphilium sp.]